LRLLLLALLMTFVGVLLTGCDRAAVRRGGAVVVTRTSHARAEAKRRAPGASSLRTLLHAHTETRSEALYEDEDDDDDDIGLAGQGPEAQDDDVAPSREVVAALGVSLPARVYALARTRDGLGPSSGHARSTEPPPRA
jgi:hypothetical protein